MTQPSPVPRTRRGWRVPTGAALVILIVICFAMTWALEQRHKRRKAAEIPTLRQRLRQKWEGDVDSTLRLVGLYLHTNDPRAHTVIGSELAGRGQDCRRRMAMTEPDYRLAFGDSAFDSFRDYCMSYWSLGLMLTNGFPRAEIHEMAVSVAAKSTAVKNRLAGASAD